MSFKKVKITVDGHDVLIDIDSELEIAGISKDMDQVAAKMGYFASVWAAAASEAERVDAEYRTWRAKAGEAALSREPKLAEWKVKQAIESDPTFLKYKDKVARATRNVVLTKGVFQSFNTKASMLQSKGAMQRSELDATGMTTRSSRRKPSKDDGDNPAKSAMRKANKKKRTPAKA